MKLFFAMIVALVMLWLLFMLILGVGIKTGEQQICNEMAYQVRHGQLASEVVYDPKAPCYQVLK